MSSAVGDRLARPSRRRGGVPLLTIGLLGGVFAFPVAALGYELRSRDKVIYVGDSNTHVRYGFPALGSAMRHTEIAEDYTTLRFPNLKAQFVNRALPGTSARDALARLDGILAERPTVLFVVLGAIDAIAFPKEPERVIDRFIPPLTEIVARTVASHIRIVVCSYPVMSNDPAHLTGSQSFYDLLALLGTRSQEVVTAAGGTYVDLHFETRVLAEQAGAAGENVGDGLHLNVLGNAATGFAMLKGLGAMQEDNLSVVNLDTGTTPPAVRWENRASVAASDWNPTERRLTFTRRDLSQPLSLWPLARREQVLAIVPFRSTVSFHNLAVSGLPSGQYQVRAAGRFVTEASAAQLAGGVNLAMQGPQGDAGGPWDAHALAFGGAARVKHIATDQAIEGLYFHLPDFDPKVNPSRENLLLAQRAKQARTALLRVERRLARPTPYEVEVAP